MIKTIALTTICSLAFSSITYAQSLGTEDDAARKFRQLEEVLPSPNMYRSASGAPGPMYWQQKVDYIINATLDEDEQRIMASMDISYTNNSPDTLTYLWLALDQNRFKDGSLARMSATSSSVGTRRDSSRSGDS